MATTVFDMSTASECMDEHMIANLVFDGFTVEQASKLVVLKKRNGLTVQEINKLGYIRYLVEQSKIEA